MGSWKTPVSGQHWYQENAQLDICSMRDCGRHSGLMVSMPDSKSSTKKCGKVLEWTNIYFWNQHSYRWQNTRYITLNLLHNIVSLQVLGLMFAFFTLRDQLVVQQIFCCGLKLLRKVQGRSALSNKFWLCCSFFIKIKIQFICLFYLYYLEMLQCIARWPLETTRLVTQQICPCCMTSWRLLYVLFCHRNPHGIEECSSLNWFIVVVFHVT